MAYLPVINVMGAAVLEHADFFSTHNLKWIAFNIIALKWIHYSLSWAARVIIDYIDLSYTGDVLGATFVKLAISNLVYYYGILGKSVVSFFIAPFLNGAYHSQQLQYYFPSLMYHLFVAPIQASTGLYLGYDIF